jgi:hypothetical protein
MLASGVIADRAAVGQEAKSDNRSELVLTNLPPRGSRAYKDLLGLAGKEANGQVLGFTQSEVWSMPSSRIDDVIRQGETLGVKMTRLGADWNQVLKPPSAPIAMSGSQETMLRAMSGSKETHSPSTMASPNAAIVEYALMKDHDPKSAIRSPPAALISEHRHSLNEQRHYILGRCTRRQHDPDRTWRGEIDGTGEPVMIMWWKSGRFTGMLTYRGHIYTLMNMGGEVHAVIETDPGKMPPDHGAKRPQGATQAPSTDVKDDPLVARGEGAAIRPRDRSRLGDRQDGLGEQRHLPTLRPQQLHRCPLRSGARWPQRRSQLICWSSIRAGGLKVHRC